MQILQLLRLIKYATDNLLDYVDYWIEEVLVDLIPDLDQCRHPVFCPPYFQALALIMSDEKMLDIITPGNWKVLTNRMVYKGFISSFPAPKVESDASVSFSEVWKRNQHYALTPENARDYSSVSKQEASCTGVTFPNCTD